MTQSDDTSGREASCESKIIEETLNGQRYRSHPTEKEEEDSSRVPCPTSKEHLEAPEESEPSEPLATMGSTDSASNAHTTSSSCGLVSSLFPNSCRGRAESFARRLHRRLTSLGGETGDQSEDKQKTKLHKPNEHSWLHARPLSKPIISSEPGVMGERSEERVLESQPHRNSSSVGDSDVYYDFDLEEPGSGGTISPVEMANAAELAKILVNPEILKSNHHEACHCPPGPRPPDNELENGVFASPINGLSPDEDNSEIYFDPESSETDKSRNESFFDPQGVSSESESTFNEAKKPATRRRLAANHDKNDSEELSESSSSSSKHLTLEKVKPSVRGSSEESTNGRSSPETTSNSHESLWSTFDESTMSLQEETGSEETSDTPTRLSKSHSDSEILRSKIVAGGKLETPKFPVKNESGQVRTGSDHSEPLRTSPNHSEPPKSVDEVDFARAKVNHEPVQACPHPSEPLQTCPKLSEPVQSSPNQSEPVRSRPNKSEISKNRLRVEELSSEDAQSTESDHSTYSSTIDIPGALVLECPTGRRLTPTRKESLKNQVNIRIGESYKQEDITKLVERLARSPHVDHQPEELPKNGKPSQQEDESSSLSSEDSNEQEEQEEEDDRPQRVRRCSSLKTGKTPPGTPGRKKIVRFADVLGLDLADVRTFLDEIPKIPNSAYSDLIYDAAFQKDSSPVNFWGTAPATFTTPLFAASMAPKNHTSKLDRILVPLFQQPGGHANFLDVVRERQVCLENVLVQDPVSMCLQGTVRVRNLDFHKSVHVRYTLDSWRSFTDLQANYAANSCDGFSDKFTFSLYCQGLRVGQRLELAVRFQCKGTQYWDNNCGINYCFQCLPATPANHSSYGIAASLSGSPSIHDWSPTFY